MTGTALATSVTSAPLAIDNLPPAVTSISSITPNPTGADKVKFGISFGEGVQKFDAQSDLLITKTGGVAYNAVAISGGPRDYTVDVSGVSGEGTLSIALNGKSDARDLAGNPLAATGVSAMVRIDRGVPTVTVTPATPSPTNADAVVFSVVFSESVGATFAADDITLGGALAGASAVRVEGTDPNYSVVVTPTDPNANGDVSISIGAGVTDVAGNALAPYGPSPAILIDNAAPTVAIAPTGAASVNADSAAFSITFSEPVAQTFAADDVALTGTLASAASFQLSGTDPAFSALLAPNDPNANGTLGLIVGNGVTDAAGNAPSAPTIGPLETFDNTPPTVTVTLATPALTNADAIVFNVVFSEPVAPTFGPDDAAASGSLAAGAVVAVEGTDPVYVVTVTPADPGANGTVGVVINGDVADAAGNKFAGPVESPLATVDNQPVTAKISTPSERATGVVEYKVEFDKAIPASLTPDNVILSGTLAAGASTQIAGQDNTYTIKVTPADPKASGTLGLSLGAGVSGPAGNPITVTAEPPLVNVDSTCPSLAISSASSTPTRADSVAFNLLFSEPVEPTFTLEDIVLTGTLGVAATAQLWGMDPYYTVVTTPNDPNGTGDIAIVVGTGVTDGAGNPLPAPVESPKIFVDNEPPMAKFELITPNPAGAASVQFAVTFSEPVAPSFNTDNLALTGTLAADASAKIFGADPRYLVTVQPNDLSAAGTLGIIIGGGVVDAAGNAYTGGASDLYTK
jgi:methionine-rich copper-binding protein CopC